MVGEAKLDGSVGQGNDGPGKGRNSKLVINTANPAKGCRFAVLRRLNGEAAFILKKHFPIGGVSWALIKLEHERMCANCLELLPLLSYKGVRVCLETLEI